MRADRKISSPWVDDLPYAVDSSKPTFYWDPELKGFGVKVNRTSKRYIADTKVNGSTVRADLGEHRVISAEEARKKARVALGKMHDGINPNAERRAKREKGRALREICEEYLHYKPIGERTKRDYLYHMGRTVVELMDRPFLQIRREEIEKLYKKKSQATDSPAQANQAFRFVRAVFQFAKRYRDAEGHAMLPENPVDVLSENRLWLKVAKRTRYIKTNQLRAVWEALWQLKNDKLSHDRETIRDLILVLLFTGLRFSEAQKLKWSDLDFAAKTLTLEVTKNHLPHILPWSDYLGDLFQRRYSERGRSKWVFPSTRLGGNQPIVEPDKQLEHIVSNSGVKFTAHDLRRTFTTAANRSIPSNHNVYLIKRLVNHKVADVTGDYIQYELEEIRESMQAITNYILRHSGAFETRIGMLSPPVPPVPQARRIRLRKPEPITVRVSV